MTGLDFIAGAIAISAVFLFALVAIELLDWWRSNHGHD